MRIALLNVPRNTASFMRNVVFEFSTEVLDHGPYWHRRSIT
jgi:hypothetical protein